MIGKRIIGHILNKVIMFIPSMLLLGGIALVISPNHFIFGKDESGWLILNLVKYIIFLPTVFLDLIKSPFEFIGIIQIILPTLICFVIIETITIKLIKCDIGMKIMGLKILSTKNKPLSLFQIIVRTTIKYFSLAFLPFVLLSILLSKEGMTLHDKVSYTKVVKRKNNKLNFIQKKAELKK